MVITEWRYFEGPNVHAHRPVVEAILDIGAFTERLTRDIPSFNDLIIRDFEGLADHHCGLGRPGGFVTRLREGTLLGHVVEHIALEIQTLAGESVTWGKTRQADTPSLFRVIFEAPSASIGIGALRASLGWVRDRAVGRDFDAPSRLEGALDRLHDLALGPSSRAIFEAARRRQIPVRRIGDGALLELGWGRHARRFEASLTDQTGVVATDIAGDKSLTKRLLEAAGLPVAVGEVVETVEDGLLAAARIGWPVVTKPLDGNQGHGVTLAIRTKGEFRRAFAIARRVAPRVMVERHIEGRQYRLLVVGDRVVAASERHPASVVGDGRHTIRELVDLLNRDPMRGKKHEKPLTRITVDPVVLLSLRRRSLTLDTVPPAGETVDLRESANLSTGGTAEDVTDVVTDDMRRSAVRAARIVGLDVAGVDLIVPGPDGPLREGAILEVNASPGLRMHEYPSKGKPRRAGEAIVRHLFPRGRGRIPLAAVTGTNGKSTTVRLIARMLAETGLVVGTTTTDGVHIGGENIASWDASGPRSARIVLSDRRVEAAVLEVARGGILREGLGYDLADVGVVTNITPDHLGLEGIASMEELAHVKSLVIERVHPGGACVLNADDAWSLSLAVNARAPVILTSRQSENLAVKRHLAMGGRAVFVHKGRILLSEGDRIQPLVEAAELGFTFGGRSGAMTENALLAIAAGWGLGVDPGIMATSLGAFGCTPDDNPGRFNVYQVGSVRVMLDYAHNAPAIRAAVETGRLLGPRQLIGVVGIPGDRRDEDIRMLAEAAARGFDRVIFKEDQDLRGRRPGEVLALLEQAALGDIRRKAVVETIPSEVEALRRAILAAEPGDVVCTFYEKRDPLLAVLAEGKPPVAASASETVTLVKMSV